VSELAPTVGHSILDSLGRYVDWVVARHRAALSFLLGAQLVCTIAFFLTVVRNGWLTYQGGDQIWLVTSGWALGNGEVPQALTGFGWPLLLAPLTWISGASSVEIIPYAQALTLLVLAPLATWAVYDIGVRLAGHLAGLWCALIWVTAPFLAIPLFVASYHDRWTEQFLPQALGLTQLADFPSLVALLVAAAFLVRSLTARSLNDAVVAGLVVGFAIGIKPSNALFLGGPFIAFVLARRWREVVVFGVAIGPGVVALALWKYRGTGSIPLFALPETHLAASSLPRFPVADSWRDRVRLDPDSWKENMSNLREFFWSARLAQWAPVAGAVALARRSVPATSLLFVWLAGFVVVKGFSDVASIESGSFWRLVMPSLPAFVLLIAATPLLVPGFEDRLGVRLEPVTSKPVSRRVLAIAAVLSLVPIAIFSVMTTKAGPERALVQAGILVPVDPDTVAVSATKDPSGVRLSWTDTTARAKTFYKVFRATGSDVSCSDECVLQGETLAVVRGRTYVDRAPLANAVYRIGVAANWKNDPEQGDVFLLSRPVRP
jgi:hypothetical protein